MRGMVRAFFLLSAVLPAFLTAPSPAAAQDRNFVITEGADYFGADYDVRQDVDLDQCQAACAEDGACQAFTYNVDARWCFLKSDVGELRSVAGAVSGRVVTTAEVVPNVEEQRIAELTFLPQNYVDEARRFIGRLQDATPVNDSLDETLAEAERAASTDALQAAEYYRAAIGLAPERYDLWTRFAEAAFRASSDDWEVMQRLAEDRTAASVNAFLRAVSIEDQAYALELIGYSLSLRYDWKPSIRAYRASLALVEDVARRETYDRLMAEHGFRILEHVVEADTASPRICLNFSEQLADNRGDLADFVTVEGGQNLAVEAGGYQICIDGVEHGRRYQVTVRSGLPAADGETIQRNVSLDVFVRDRAPTARFLSSAYVLPAGGDPTIPVVTVNTTRINATLYRIGDRALADTIADGMFRNQLSYWETDEIESRSGEMIWEGTVDVASEINREMTTAIPVGDIEDDLEPGAYVLVAQAVNDTDEWSPKATQWFVVTDLGLTTLSGNDGLHVMVRSLGTAEPVSDVSLRLVAINNEILGEATTDATGYAILPPGLMRGTGGMAPGLIVAETESGDYSFIDLTGTPMDLTDRGVEGRDPPAPLDVFLTTERGIYRVGETVYVTSLVRDAIAMASPGVPLTAIVTRPDGKEQTRIVLADQGLGGVVTPVNIPSNGMRGAWRVGVYADVDEGPLAETSFLVEDFDPERLDFDIGTETAALEATGPAFIDVAARFLYGAPGAGLNVEGETMLRTVRALTDYAGYVFGLDEEAFNPTAVPFSGVSTDEEGNAIVEIALPDTSQSSRPLEASINVRVLDTSGTPVERNLVLPVDNGAARLGIRPLFTGDAGENSNAAFELIAVNSAGERAVAEDVEWTLNQINTDYQWYRADGRWNYEVIETRTRVADGSVDIGVDRAASIEGPVTWGSYELVVETTDASALPASYRFEAGWYVEPQAVETPEALKVSLDKPQYAVGETALVHLETRFSGIALVMVVDDRLITTETVEVTGTSADVEIEVTRDWGPGAYVTAVLYRPMDIEARRMPARAIGLAWAGVDPADRDIDVEISAPEEMRPRQLMDVEIELANLEPGDEAYVTLAAVDLGILNLTQFETPDPEAWYFGQRRLGIAIYDIYNQLIDRMQGVRGAVRSGGDALAARMAGPVPTEALVAFHSGIVEVGEDGVAHVSVPVPDFNGTVRLMALAWSSEGVGHAEEDVLVRDPVVIVASLPNFLAPGDESRLQLDLTSVEDADGAMRLAVTTSETAVSVDPSFADREIELVADQREQILVPISAEAVGEDVINVALTLPDGEVLEKALNISVRLNEPPLANASFVELAPGGVLSITPDALEGLYPGTASVQVAASGAGRLNVPAILRALDRYPYGCTEQIASRAMPLVYLNDVALQAGLGVDPDIHARVQDAVEGVLANQSASGSFGLWSPGGEDLWLDAYVTDFLTRARQRGFVVPAEALSLALDNLKNRLAYIGEFTAGGEDVAYALYVLAANSRASIGDLRYYVEIKLEDFATPLAKAQLGAALALYGDTMRAEMAFASALADLETSADDTDRWRVDYGSPLRDGAAMLTLASETRTEIDLIDLSRRIEAERQRARYTSTQEDAWTLMAAHALMETLSPPELVVDGEPLEGPLFRGLDAESLAASPLTIENHSDRAIEIALTVRGIPVESEPASGNYYTLTRSYYTLEGEPVDMSAVAQGERLVAVLDVVTTETQGARLIVDDPLPAGFEIDNPHLLASGDVAALDWLNLQTQPSHVEFRADRFVAAVDLYEGSSTSFQFAYIVRAISPGTFLHPAALVEDMYRPERRARTDTGSIEIVGPLR